jgi:flavin-dependent dehydrogenase
MRLPGSPLVAGDLLLVGDAAGLLDPFSGEGIYAAIRSGRAAARHLSVRLAGQSTDLQGYALEIERDLVPELRAARRLYELFQVVPLAYTEASRRLPAVWDLICDLMRGDRTYRDLRRHLGPAWPVIEFGSDLLRRSAHLQRRFSMGELPAPERFLRRASRLAVR